jgi:hypothetical protein
VASTKTVFKDPQQDPTPVVAKAIIPKDERDDLAYVAPTKTVFKDPQQDPTAKPLLSPNPVASNLGLGGTQTTSLISTPVPTLAVYRASTPVPTLAKTLTLATNSFPTIANNFPTTKPVPTLAVYRASTPVPTLAKKPTLLTSTLATNSFPTVANNFPTTKPVPTLAVFKDPQQGPVPTTAISTIIPKDERDNLPKIVSAHIAYVVPTAAPIPAVAQIDNPSTTAITNTPSTTQQYNGCAGFTNAKDACNKYLDVAGKWWNFATFGGFDNYTNAYQEVAAQNPNASYLQQVVNPQGAAAAARLGLTIEAEAVAVIVGAAYVVPAAITAADSVYTAALAGYIAKDLAIGTIAEVIPSVVVQTGGLVMRGITVVKTVDTVYQCAAAGICNPDSLVSMSMPAYVAPSFKAPDAKAITKFILNKGFSLVKKEVVESIDDSLEKPAPNQPKTEPKLVDPENNLSPFTPVVNSPFAQPMVSNNPFAQPMVNNNPFAQPAVSNPLTQPVVSADQIMVIEPIVGQATNLQFTALPEQFLLLKN